MSLIPERPFDRGRALAPVGLDRDLPPLRRAADGRVDLDWYLARAHSIRSAQARDLAGALWGKLGAFARRWRDAYRARRARDRAIAELSRLDERTLHDLGLVRSGIHHIVDHGRENLPRPANAPRTADSRLHAA